MYKDYLLLFFHFLFHYYYLFPVCNILFFLISVYLYFLFIQILLFYQINMVIYFFSNLTFSISVFLLCNCNSFLHPLNNSFLQYDYYSNFLKSILFYCQLVLSASFSLTQNLFLISRITFCVPRTSQHNTSRKLVSTRRLTS